MERNVGGGEEGVRKVGVGKEAAYSDIDKLSQCNKLCVS